MVGGVAVCKAAGGRLPSQAVIILLTASTITRRASRQRSMALRHSSGGESGQSFFWRAYDSGALAAGLFAVGLSLAIGLAIGSSQASPATCMACAGSHTRCHRFGPLLL